MLVRTPVTDALAKPNVLLAEDDDDLRAVLAEALRDDGCDVVEAVDGAAALEYLAAALAGRGGLVAPDVIVSDLRMPGYSGLDLLTRVRRWDDHVPVVLITAFGDQPIHETAERLGAVAVLDKPFSIEELRATVIGLASRYSG